MLNLTEMFRNPSWEENLIMWYDITKYPYFYNFFKKTNNIIINKKLAEFENMTTTTSRNLSKYDN